MVGASNVFNQIIERDLDALMERTKNRPIPAARMSVTYAFILAIVLTVGGLSILYSINERTAMFGAISICLYTSAYTPLKTKNATFRFCGSNSWSDSVYAWDGLRPLGNLELRQVFCSCFSFFGNFHTFGLSVGFYTMTTRKQALICYQQENVIKELRFKPLFIPFGRPWLISIVPAVLVLRGDYKLSIVAAWLLTLAAGFWFLIYYAV